MFIFYLIDPLPVLGFESISLNETSIQLQWSNPINSSFSSIELRCSLNDTFIFELIIHSNTLTSYTIGNLVPGTLYNCFITLIKEANSLIARSKTLSAIQMTSTYFDFDLNLIFILNRTNLFLLSHRFKSSRINR